MTTSKHKSGDEHWLDRPRNIKIVIVAALVVLAGSVLADFFYHDPSHFGVDGWFGFYAWYGFITCVAMVVGAKLLGYLIKRPDDYYDDE
jgi:hypothetical protein